MAAGTVAKGQVVTTVLGRLPWLPPAAPWLPRWAHPRVDSWGPAPRDGSDPSRTGAMYQTFICKSQEVGLKLAWTIKPVYSTACSVVSSSLLPYGLYPTRLLSPCDSPGKNTRRGLPRPPPRNLPNLGIEPTSLTSPALAGGFFTTSTTWKAHSPI